VAAVPGGKNATAETAASAEIADAGRRSLSAGDGVTFASQLFRNFFLHLERRFERHWVQMLIKLGHQFETVFSNHPCGLVTIFVILESVINWQTCHADVDTWLALIARGIGRKTGVLGDSIIEQNDVTL
jgi:hypothetical protein